MDGGLIMEHTPESMGWVCNEWNEAMLSNTASGWKRAQTLMHGAALGLLHCDKFDEYADFSMLHSIAIDRLLDCLMECRK